MGNEVFRVKILIIDDDPVSSKLLSERIVRSNRNFEVHVLSDPELAVSVIQGLSPHLVFLDYQMPTISGLDCIRHMRTYFSKIDLPVIMLTAEESTDIIVQCIDAGANDYILKGAPTAIISSRIKLHTSLMMMTKQNVKAKEIEAVMAVVVSYNHEINNPLSIAFGTLYAVKDKIDEKQYERLKDSLTRITDVVKSISGIGEKYGVEYMDYTETEKVKMLKLKSKA